MFNTKLLVAFLVIVDVSLSTSVVLDSISCDFNDHTLCQYETPTPDKWLIHHGQYPDVLNGPATPLPGSQAFLQMTGYAGRLDSPEVRLSGQYCVSLDFFIIGNTMRNELVVYAESTSIDRGTPDVNSTFFDWQDNRFKEGDIPFFARGASSGFLDEWQHFETAVNLPDDTYRVKIDGLAIQDKFDVIALDNLKFTQGPCNVQEPDSKYCDFDSVVGSADPENIQCDWLTVANAENATFEDRARVLIGKGTFRSDFTTKTWYGGFLDIQGDVNRAQIQFPTITPQDGHHCMSFAAKAKFNVSNTLSVFETAIETGSRYYLLSQGYVKDEDWKRYNIDIDPVVAINITLQVGGGHLALDDIRLQPGKCPKPIDCTFQNNYCNWKIGAMWKIGRGRLTLPSDNRDDDYPHKYLYHDFTSEKIETRRTIESEVVHGGGEQCFQIVFKAQNVTNLIISKRVKHGNHVSLTALSDPQTEWGGDWTTQYFNIKEEHKFQLLITLKLEATRRHRYVQIFKIREVQLLTGRCGQTSVHRPQFSSVQFHCFQTGHYISMYRSCDGVIDCPMGEDEGAQCSGGHECSNGGIPCTRRGHKFCLNDNQKICNGVQDCDDSIDEDPRMCRHESFCDSYCLNGGVCQHESFNCACEAGFAGKRCSSE